MRASPTNSDDAGTRRAVRLATVIALTALVSLLEGFDIACMGIAVPLIARDWGVAPAAFGPALGLAFVGVAIGGMICGPLGDRVGRKAMIVASSLIIGAGTFGVISAGGLGSLALWRLLTGFGLGAGIPNLYALVSDHFPDRRRLLATTVLASAISAGGVVAGVLALVLTAGGRWTPIFVFGGALSLVAGLAALLLLPESPGFRPAPAPMGDRPAPAERPFAAVGALIGRRYGAVSLALWLAWAANAFSVYLLLSWMPSLLLSAGWQQAAALRSVSWIYGGAIVGGIALALLADRLVRQSAWLVTGAMAAGAALLFGAVLVHGAPLFQALLFAIGAVLGGVQYVLPGLGTRYFPPAMLGTAIGWIGSLSRLGAIVSPIVGGRLLAAHWPLASVLALLGATSLVSVAGLIGLAVIAGRHPMAGAA